MFLNKAHGFAKDHLCIARLRLARLLSFTAYSLNHLAICRQILLQHITKQGALFDGVIERLMGVGERIKPVFGHVTLGAVAVVGLHDRHGKGLDVQRRVAEGTVDGELS